MDPVIGSALISAGGSLLGGIFGKKKDKYVVPDYQQIRDKAEAAGFNPLTALGSAPGSVVPGQNYMGSAIADAALMLADGYAKHKERAQLERMTERAKKLEHQVQNLTLRPKVGGIYAQRISSPAIGGRNGSLEDSSADLSGGLAVSSGAVSGRRPPTHPFREPIPMIPVRDMGGVPTSIPKGVADRLGIGPFDTMVMEDLEALYGDEVGQVIGLPRVGDAYVYHTTGVPPESVVARYRSAADRLDRLDAMNRKPAKPRTRTTDWEREHRSRWLYQ